jgi:N-methylhydantoinase A
LASEAREIDSAGIAVDIGGTFTDIVLRRSDGAMFVHKVSSTTAAPERAVVAGIGAILAHAEVAPGAVREILHGTTVGSNAILQRAGARTGLLTTRGFRDVLEIGRVRTPELYDLAWDKPEPLVRRRHRLEVGERIAADGSVLEPLDEADVLTAAGQLVAEGVEAVALCFLNSYRNPAHERAAAELVRNRHPEIAVCASIDILPQIKEYERTSTTVVNAYLLPVMRRYLDRLKHGLEEIGIEAPILVITSNGGAVGIETAAERPVFFIGSGPAAGVVGAARLARAIEIADAIAFDMGGTTAKAALIEDGAFVRTQEYEFRAGISTSSRFIKAGGYLLKVPAIDIAEVGAGAGSIATVDEGGLLQVGPASAGAEPGPACYGQGGTRATVTDANVVLGLLNPEQLVGGALALQPALARAAIERDVAGPLRLAVEAAALGIRRLANANMARALRAVTVERGLDPRDHSLIAFGGSGPVHACDLAAALGIRRVIVPPLSGVFTAVGMLESDVERPFVRAFPGDLQTLRSAGAAEVLGELEADARAALAAEGFRDGEVHFEADLRFEGQDSELILPLERATLTASGLAELAEGFRAEYRRLYAYESDEPVEVVNLRALARGVRAKVLDRRHARLGLAARTAGAAARAAWIDDSGAALRVPVLERTLLEATFTGPLIIEAYDTTVIVPPGWRGRADPLGNLILEPA